jgi:hypothetical protein
LKHQYYWCTQYIAINVVLYNAVAVRVEWRLPPYHSGTAVTTGLPHHSSTAITTVAFKVRQSLTAPSVLHIGDSSGKTGEAEKSIKNIIMVESHFNSSINT